MLWCNNNDNISSIDDIIHHKEIIDKLKNITHIQNIFFYGVKGSGKYSIIKYFLKYLLKIENDTLFKKIIPVSTTKDLVIYQNNYYYYINIQLLSDSKVEHYLFNNFILNIIKSKNILEKQHIFFFDNLDKNNYDIVHYFKIFCSKYNQNCKFIISSVDYNVLEKSKIESFFIKVRIPQIKTSILEKILNDFSKKFSNKKLNKQTSKKIIEYSQHNLSKSITLLQLKTNNVYEFNQYISRTTKYFDKLFKLIKSKQKIQNIESFREFLYEHYIKFSGNKFIKQFTKYLLNHKKVNDNLKHKIIDIASNLEYKNINVSKIL